MICTVQQARDRGADGTNPQVQAAIAEATDRIMRFCGECFEPTVLTLRTQFSGRGIALLPRRVISVSSVRYLLPYTTSALDASTYRVTSSSEIGAVDSIEIVRAGWNDLIVGAERYNGGYSNLIRDNVPLEVVGTFGWAVTPVTVSRYAAILAAELAKPGTPEGELSGVRSLSVEGYSVTFDTANDESVRSTGLLEVDRALQGYRRGRVRVG